MSEESGADRFRCSVGAQSEQLAGTAAVESAYLLIEHPGPWGHQALAESVLPAQVRTGVADAAERAGVRVQLIRRHGRAVPDQGFRVFVAHAVPGNIWLETTTLDVAEDLLDLDLDAVGQGRRPGLDPHDAPLLLVCTNGRRDACCAEFGRPVAAALADAHPQETWETTHLGGHRFAGAMLALPHGLAYGRVGTESALTIAEATIEGRLVTAHLRGRGAYSAAAQAAEVALLEHLGEDGIDALALAGIEGSEISFRHASGAYRVTVTESPGEPIRASCADTKLKRTSRFAATLAAD